MGSLERIFLQWLPQTTASLADRLKALDRLRAKEPAVAWVLLRDLLPHRASGAVFTNAEPAWRDWIPGDRNQRPAPDYRQAVAAMVERLLLDVSADEARWAELAGKLDIVASCRVPSRCLSPSGDRSARPLTDCPGAIVGGPSRSHIDTSELSGGRLGIACRADRSDAGSGLEVRTLEPDTPARLAVRRYASRLRFRRGRLAATELKLRPRRRDAATEVFGSSGPDGLVALATRAPVPGLVGDVAGELVLLSPNEEAALLQTCLGHADGARANLARGYAIGRQRSAAEWPGCLIRL